MKLKYFFLIWCLSVLISIVYGYENPEKIDAIKNLFKKDQNEKEEKLNSALIAANSFDIHFEEVLEFKNGFKTAFINYKNKNQNTFDTNDLAIYFQNGQIFENNNSSKKFLFNNFTDDFNGGIKNFFIHNDTEFAYLTMLENECYYVAIVNTLNNKEIFRTKCLENGEINFNGVGGASLHLKDSILLSIGAPGWNGIEIAKLSQNKESFFGKIVEIEKNQLDQIISGSIEKINPKIFSFGHRNPQGLTNLNDLIFSTEHGPKGGDELNLIKEGKNYGWPISSYGVKYDFDQNNTKFLKSHEDYNFEEPLFALVPSVGLSSLNNCPKMISNYYKKPCLMALSLWGNELRQGKSLIIYLLDKEMKKVISVEKIFLGNEYPLRHFVTQYDNKLYEDIEGNIYLSVDGKGIYKLKFILNSNN